MSIAPPARQEEKKNAHTHIQRERNFFGQKKNESVYNFRRTRCDSVYIFFSELVRKNKRLETMGSLNLFYTVYTLETRLLYASSVIIHTEVYFLIGMRVR